MSVKYPKFFQSKKRDMKEERKHVDTVIKDAKNILQTKQTVQTILKTSVYIY